MRAMILAAGRGERMRPLTDSTPKPLLKVNGQYLIEYHIKSLAAAGISEIVINLAYLGSQIRSTIGDGHQYNVSIQYSDEGQALETGGGIFKALPLLGNKPFVVVNGDVWTDYAFPGLLNQSVGLVHLVMVPNPPQHPDGDFTLQDEFLVNRKGKTASTFSGIGIYHPKLFAACEPGKFPLAPLLIKAMDEQLATGELYSGQWYDIGTPERLQQLELKLAGQTVPKS